jgi:two-component system cell cycle sensor histidine kinase PleC
LTAVVPPVCPETRCGEVHDRFAADADLLIIAVVDDRRPVGLVSRHAFVQHMAERGAHARYAAQPITALMDREPLIVDAADHVAEVNARIVSDAPSALLSGFIVTRDGRYLGVATALDLVRLTVEDMADRARELQEAQARAEQASRAKSQFLANMSHELRTPLNAIIGFSEIIRDQTFGPVGSPQYRDYARDIHHSGQHLLSLVNDILDLSKVEAGAIELHEEEVDLGHLLEAAEVMLRQRAVQGGVQLRIDLPEAPLAILADPRKIKQVLVNLIGNAVKFTPDGGHVQVTVRVDGDLEAVVADTGVGMSAQEIPLALTPFKRIDGDINRKVQGTGLGLPLSKALVEAHGGSLALTSEPGAGTRVVIRLPAARLIWSGRPPLERFG